MNLCHIRLRQCKTALSVINVLVTASFVVKFKHTCRQHVDYYSTLKLTTHITTVRLIMILTTDSLFQLGSVSVCSQQIKSMKCRVDTPNLVFATTRTTTKKPKQSLSQGNL